MRVKGKLTTATWLDEDTIESIIDRFEKKYRISIDVDVEVDASIIGGIIFTVGDEVFDGSARGRLECMRDQLLND